MVTSQVNVDTRQELTGRTKAEQSIEDFFFYLMDYLWLKAGRCTHGPLLELGPQLSWCI